MMQSGNKFAYGINLEIVPLPPHLEKSTISRLPETKGLLCSSFLLFALSVGSTVRYSAALHR